MEAKICVRFASIYGSAMGSELSKLQMQNTEMEAESWEGSLRSCSDVRPGRFDQKWTTLRTYKGPDLITFRVWSGTYLPTFLKQSDYKCVPGNIDGATTDLQRLHTTTVNKAAVSTAPKAPDMSRRLRESSFKQIFSQNKHCLPMTHGYEGKRGTGAFLQCTVL